jgi:hypothetical protein
MRAARARPFHRLVTGLVLIASARAARGADPADALVAATQDNSFLLQEAYNQEAGVVQSIATVELDAFGSGERDWTIGLSQEWPLFSSDHQVSFFLPVQVVAGHDAESASGLGDLVLDYRYQLLRESERLPAIAPFFGLSLPTGDSHDGLGNGEPGYQFLLPLSKVLSDRIAVHVNAGASFVPDAQGFDLDSYFGGASTIYALSADWNLLCEWTIASVQSIDDGASDRDLVSRVSPGTRYAFSLAGGRLVLGLALPIGVTPESPDWGAFAYVSFERRLWGADADPPRASPLSSAAARGRSSASAGSR